MKVYVLTVKKEQNDNNIYGVYSTRGKAVEEADNLAPCCVNVTEFELDGNSEFIHTIVY